MIYSHDARLKITKWQCFGQSLVRVNHKELSIDEKDYKKGLRFIDKGQH